MDKRREIEEAIDAADEALKALYDAYEYLKSASHWGLADIFLDSGPFATVVKHRKINQANQVLSSASWAVRRLARELRDVHDLEGLEVDVGLFWTFFDYAEKDGGLLADIVVQSKIKKGLQRVEQAIRVIDTVRAQLEDALRKSE